MEHMFNLQLDALSYHDIVCEESNHLSGIPGELAGLYKLTPDSFKDHLKHIATEVKKSPLSIDNLRTNSDQQNNWMITFDDGGVSAYNETADIIENYNWRGHFFVITDFIGMPGYLTNEHVRELRLRGHVIGSHTCSHPYPISRLSVKKQRAEWGDSLEKLSDILGEKVSSGAFPGGDYSFQAASAASRAGVRFLFTLEPTRNTWVVEDCILIGRYLIRRNTSPSKAAALASGRKLHRWTRWLTWNAKKLPKHIAGSYYDKLKVMIVER